MVSHFTDFATKLRNEKVKPLVQTEGPLREVHDAITDMMKQIANEPSVGLYFVQQHVHKAVPAMVSLKVQVVSKTQEVEYVTQDVRDALNSVRSMKEVGPDVIERMTKTLDSSSSHLASLRPTKRDENPQDSLTRSGDYKDSGLLDPSEQQSSSPSVEERNSAAPTLGPSGALDPHSVQDRLPSAPNLVEKNTPGRTVSEADYAGYVKTMFGSALQKASSVTVANVAKWNAYTKGSGVQFGVASELHGDVKSGAAVQGNPQLLGEVHYPTSSLENTVPDLTGIKGSNEIPSLPRDGLEVPEASGPSLGRGFSLPTFREVTDLGRPTQYLRAVFGSRQVVGGNERGEDSGNLSSADKPKFFSSLDKSLEGWNWLRGSGIGRPPVHPNSRTEEVVILNDARDKALILDPDTSDSESNQELQRLLDAERANYDAFSAEKTAKLEAWLEDTTKDDEAPKE